MMKSNVNNSVNAGEESAASASASAQSNPAADAAALYRWGNAKKSKASDSEDVKNLFGDARAQLNNAIGPRRGGDSFFYNWGCAFLALTELKEDNDYRELFKRFKKASEDVNDPYVCLIRGELFFVLNEKTDDIVECFRKSEKTILEILTFLDYENRKRMIKAGIFRFLLESGDTAAVFFRKTTRNLAAGQKKDIDKYMDAYIRSTYIVSLLHVSGENEKSVAYYREKGVAQKLLFDGGSKFRLNAIDYSNDASEGRVLLKFLFGEKTRAFDDKINAEEYEAFAACFILDYDNLNMFRLYGKNEDGEEGTGVSLVFRNSFFRNDAKDGVNSSKNDSSWKDKLPLFRCIYIDPDSAKNRFAVAVGRKDEHLFYREGAWNEFNDYDEKMRGIVDDVRREMGCLKYIVRNLDPEVVRQLLLTLRYLVKHIAFKEEQECRILTIRPLSKNKEIAVAEDYNRIYIEYLPKVSGHIEKIYFGPKFEGGELFQAILKNNGLDIHCEKSKSPLA